MGPGVTDRKKRCLHSQHWQLELGYIGTHTNEWSGYHKLSRWLTWLWPISFSAISSPTLWVILLGKPSGSKNKRVTIEEAEDEEDYLRDGRYFEQYLDAGKPLREGQTNFEQYQQYQEEEGEDEWAPFGDA